MTKAQEIYLNLIEACGHWNTFNGTRIAADLRAHADLWSSAVLTALPMILDGTVVSELRHRVNLVALRDLPNEHVNLDTLFILPHLGRQDAVEALVRAWSPDEVTWISLREGSRAMGASKFRFQDYSADEARFLLRARWN